MAMIADKTGYVPVAEIDECTIYADDEHGYFTIEHYVTANAWWATIIPLGRTGKEVHKTMADCYEWNYRAWHGEMEKIIEAGKLADALPEI